MFGLQQHRYWYKQNGVIVVDANGAYFLNNVSVNNPISAYKYYNVQQDGSLLSSGHWMGINFSTVPGAIPNSGKAVGQTPIEFKFIRTFTRGNCENLLLRAFCCVERIMILKNGEVSVTYS
jgi:hypothetical protein